MILKEKQKDMSRVITKKTALTGDHSESKSNSLSSSDVINKEKITPKRNKPTNSNDKKPFTNVSINSNRKSKNKKHTDECVINSCYQNPSGDNSATGKENSRRDEEEVVEVEGQDTEDSASKIDTDSLSKIDTGSKKAIDSELTTSLSRRSSSSPKNPRNTQENVLRPKTTRKPKTTHSSKHAQSMLSGERSGYNVSKERSSDGRLRSSQICTGVPDKIVEAVFVEGFSISKLFTSLVFGLPKEEIITLKFSQDTIMLDERGINDNIQINVTLYTKKLFDYSYNTDYDELRIDVNVKKMNEKIFSKKSQNLTLRIINDKKSPFRYDRMDIKDEIIPTGGNNANKSELEAYEYTTKPIRIRSSTLIDLIKSCATKYDDHINIKCYNGRVRGIIMKGFKIDGSVSFHDQAFGMRVQDANQEDFMDEVKISKNTIRMIEKQVSVPPLYALSEVYIEEDKPLCIKTLIGLYGFIDIYAHFKDDKK